MEHTKEPWSIETNGKYTSIVGKDSIHHNVTSNYSNGSTIKDFPRIVECVNECAGLSVDEIKEAVKRYKYVKDIQS